MKSLKFRVKVMTVAITAVIYGMSFIPGSAFGQTPAPVKFQQEKTDLKGDLAAIKFHREQIKSIESKYREDKRAGREAAVANDEKELMRANGELKMAKAYVQSDKAMLISNYNLTISSHKAAMKEVSQKLTASRTKLNHDIKNGNEDAVDNDATAVVQHQKELNRLSAALHRERINKNSDILAVNKEIKNANGEFVGSLYAENAVASTYNWVEK